MEFPTNFGKKTCFRTIIVKTRQATDRYVDATAVLQSPLKPAFRKFEGRYNDLIHILMLDPPLGKDIFLLL